MTRISTLLATAMVALSLTACSGNSTAANGPEPSTSREAKVKVQNNNWSDMTIVLERAGRRMRLGTVTSMTSRLLSIPSTFLAGSGGVRVVLDPLGGTEAYRTETVELWPGQVLDLTIQNHVGISSVSVWDN